MSEPRNDENANKDGSKDGTPKQVENGKAANDSAAHGETPRDGKSPMENPTRTTPSSGRTPQNNPSPGMSPEPSPKPLTEISPGMTPQSDRSPDVKDSSGVTGQTSKDQSTDSQSKERQKPSVTGDGKEGVVVDNIAPEDSVDTKTAPEPEVVDKEPGEDSQELSEMSEDDGVFGIHSKASLSSSHFMSWLGRISPLIRNRKVRYLAVVNFFLSALNTILLLVLISLLVYFVVLSVRMYKELGDDENPCMFRYGNWSECNGECWVEGDPRPPMMRRRVIDNSIIQRRGDNYKACPRDINSKYEEAPCNFFSCETSLSQYDWHQTCFYNDANRGKNGSCYQIRELPIDKYKLIRIDADLTRACDCPEFII